MEPSRRTRAARSALRTLTLGEVQTELASAAPTRRSWRTTPRQREVRIDGPPAVRANQEFNFGELGPIWLDAQRPLLKPSSWRPLEVAWRVHVAPRWADVAVADVRYSAVQMWVSGLAATVGPTTVRRALGILSGICDAAVRDRIIHTNPCAEVKTPRKTTKSHTYLSHAQVRALAAECGRHRTLVLVMAYTGLRWGEVIALRVKDLHTERRRLQAERNAVEVGSQIIVGTPKSHERRSVAYPGFLDDDLRAAAEGKHGEDLLFPGRDGSYLRRTRTDASSSGWFASAVRRSGVPRLTPHELRHTAASLAVQAGANVLVVQRMLGHQSAAMTLDVYADLFDDDLDLVAQQMNAAIRRHRGR